MPSLLQDEIDNNFTAFETQWPEELAAASAGLVSARKHFATSYTRISSIQAWRTAVISSGVDEDSAAFFFEAQNDLLISHCLARCGSFRQALKALRSAIENVFFSLYYKDHPVELAKWIEGRHRIGFTELAKYFEAHPAVIPNGNAITGLPILVDEYSTLSKAVHGSAKQFRMTQNLSDIRLWSDDLASVGKWAAREKLVIHGLNLLLLHVFRDAVQAGKNRALRETLGIVIPKKGHASIKNSLGITLITN